VRPLIGGLVVALFFAVYTAIQRTRIVPAALRAIQHIHLVYSTYGELYFIVNATALRPISPRRGPWGAL